MGSQEEEVKYRALFLDMDGTFLDFAAAEKSAFFSAMAAAGAAVTEREYRIYSAVNEGLWKAFERGEIEKDSIREGRFGLTFEKIGFSGDGLAAEKDYERFLAEGHELIPCAREVLEFLAARYPLYVVTNGFAAVQRNRLRMADIERYMTDLFISEEIGYQKPKKEFFDRCFQKIGGDLAPSQVLLVGDSLTSDILGANLAGLDACWFNPEGKENGTGARPDYEIRSLTQLKGLLGEGERL